MLKRILGWFRRQAVAEAVRRGVGGSDWPFTWEHVDALRLIGEDHERTIEGALLLDLADRIAQRLPPREL
jgi:hypothetical protein